MNFHIKSTVGAEVLGSFAWLQMCN